MYRLVLSGLVLAATAAIAHAQNGQPGGAGVNNDPNQIVCVREKETGSRLRSQRVCRTRAEWAETKDQTRKAMERAQQMQSSYVDPD